MGSQLPIVTVFCGVRVFAGADAAGEDRQRYPRVVCAAAATDACHRRSEGGSRELRAANAGAPSLQMRQTSLRAF